MPSPASRIRRKILGFPGETNLRLQAPCVHSSTHGSSTFIHPDLPDECYNVFIWNGSYNPVLAGWILVPPDILLFLSLEILKHEQDHPNLFPWWRCFPHSTEIIHSLFPSLVHLSLSFLGSFPHRNQPTCTQGSPFLRVFPGYSNPKAALDILHFDRNPTRLPFQHNNLTTRGSLFLLNHAQRIL